MPNKFLTIASLVLPMALTFSVSASEKRCGWLHNPTPGNWWLSDRNGTWIIGTQGREPAPGLELVKFFAGKKATQNFVATNINYGYYCACMNVTTNPRTNPKRITRIASGQQVLLSQCRQDPALPREPR